MDSDKADHVYTALRTLWQYSKKEGGNADVIYLDFAKAFDKIDHGILCHKL